MVGWIIKYIYTGLKQTEIATYPIPDKDLPIDMEIPKHILDY